MINLPQVVQVLESFRHGRMDTTIDEGGWNPRNHEVITKRVENARLDKEVWKEFSYSVWSAHQPHHFPMNPPLHNPISFSL
jgi:hypothetical protein